MKKVILFLSCFLIFAPLAFAETRTIGWDFEEPVDTRVQEVSIICSTGGAYEEVGRVPVTTTEYVLTVEQGITYTCKACSVAEGFDTQCTNTFVGVRLPMTLDAPNLIGIQ